MPADAATSTSTSNSTQQASCCSAQCTTLPAPQRIGVHSVVSAPRAPTRLTSQQLFLLLLQWNSIHAQLSQIANAATFECADIVVCGVLFCCRICCWRSFRWFMLLCAEDACCVIVRPHVAPIYIHTYTYTYTY